MKLPLFAITVALALAAGWRIITHDCLVADAKVEVVAEPWPANYPSTNPRSNSVVGTLAPGEQVAIWYTGYGKDFAYYKVRLRDGTWGYVISGGDAAHTGHDEVGQDQIDPVLVRLESPCPSSPLAASTTENPSPVRKSRIDARLRQNAARHRHAPRARSS